ncbi:MAG TPA: choice-of-anchor W domain-containing protein [Xenococcaceae cyanobacterium]|jgi:hypothetical protein
MLIKKAVTTISIAGLGWFLGNSPALAGYFTPMSDGTASEFTSMMDSGAFVEEFNVSSYIGDTGMASYELEVNDIVPPDTLKQSTKEQFLWENGQEVNFELSLKGGLLTYKVGETTIVSEDVIDSEFDVNGMILTANSNDTGNVSLSNLKVDDSFRSMDGLLSENSTADYLQIMGINNDFTLTGTQVFEWNEDGPRPENFELAYDIRVGNFQPNVAQQQEIPEPTTVSLFSLLAVAMGLKTRKQCKQ